MDDYKNSFKPLIFCTCLIATEPHAQTNNVTLQWIT